MRNDVADFQVTLKNIDVNAIEKQVQCKLKPLSRIKQQVNSQVTPPIIKIKYLFPINLSNPHFQKEAA